MEKNKALNLLPYGGELYYISQFIEKTLANRIFNNLLASDCWLHQTIKLFGKEVLQPRLTAFMGENGVEYSYSARRMTAIPFHSDVLKIKQLVEQTTQNDFNSVLLNYYRNGNDSMGWHRDNEKELGLNPIIASISLGETRLIKFRYYSNKKVSLKMELENGSLLLMCGKIQQNWEHCVPKQPNKINPRINLTFRKILNPS